MRPVSPLRPLLEPAVGVAFFLVWSLAQISRVVDPGSLPFYVLLGLYATALGVARRAPRVSLGIIVGVPLWQMLGVTGLTPLLRLIAPPDPSSWTIGVAAIGVAFLVGLSGDARIRALALLVGAVQALSIGYAIAASGTWLSWTGYGDGDASPGSISLSWALTLAAMDAALYLGAWAAGVALQLRGSGRRDQARIARVEEDLEVVGVELRIAQERSEIAQEVHDVLAHSLAVVVAVADGSRFLRETRPETTEEALREIAATARTALLDLRDLIEELTDDDQRPQPNLADIPALVRGMSATGMRVELRATGRSGGLTPSQQLSVYRIVQESLTNALKHARSTPTVDVSFVWQGPGLALTIRSTGSAPAPAAAAAAAAAAADSDAPAPAAGPAPAPTAEGEARRATPGGGFGTRGMKDRARLAGGWLTAERTEVEGDEETEGYVVTAYVPTFGDLARDGRRRGSHAEGEDPPAADAPAADAPAGVDIADAPPADDGVTPTPAATLPEGYRREPRHRAQDAA